MDAIASGPAADLIRQRGGRLYVWLKRGRCCGNVTTLASATEPPEDKEFLPIDAGDFQVYLPAGLERLPDELHIDVRAFRAVSRTYWNGCARVV